MAAESNNLAKLNSASSAVEKPSNVSPESFSAITTWVNLVCSNKRMDPPSDPEMEMVWLRTLQSFRPSVIDFAFSDYLSTGVGEFFDVHAIVKRCQQRMCREMSGMPKGCVDCRWTGFIYTDQQMRKVKPCPCRKDPSLQTPAPLATEADMSDVVEMVRQTLISQDHKMPDAPTADGDTQPSKSSD